MTSLDKSVVHRILATLTNNGYLSQDPTTHRYRVGLQLWELGSRCHVVEELCNIVRPLLTAVVDRYEVSGYLGILEGHEMVYVVSIPGTSPVRVYYDVGRRVPAWTTAFGKAILANLPAEELQQLIAAVSSPAERKHLNSPEFRRELKFVRSKGFSFNLTQDTPEVGSIGVPLIIDHGRIHAGISLAYLLVRDKGDLAQRLAKELDSITSLVEGRSGPVKGRQSWVPG
jgi:DNA-binding IclR family transcriptional regulator